MKVLAISSSPRLGGNSDALCDEFLKGAAQAGHETEKVSLAGKKIGPCRACYACAKSRSCVQKDDMAPLLEKLIAADVIVLATPVYFYCMSAQMKLMIDRCLPRYTAIENKKFYFIITAADPGHEAAEATIAGLRGFLDCLPGAEERGVVYGTGTWQKGDVYQHPALREAFRLGQSV